MNAELLRARLSFIVPRSSLIAYPFVALLDTLAPASLY
jgi:hypothetical protein